MGVATTKSTDVYLKADTNKLFFLIHGYTGSPGDFGQLPELLHKTFNASVRIMTLPGHCTKVSDLDSITYSDLLKPVEAVLKDEFKQGRRVIIGGLSFGAQLAINLAARYPVDGLLAIGIPYELKYPFGIPFAGALGIFKKYWKKPISPREMELRKDLACYDYMHINALKVVRAANKEIRRSVAKITCPALIIHSKHDPIGRLRGAKKIEQRLASNIKRLIVYHNDNHNIFYSENPQPMYGRIIDFFRRTTATDKIKSGPVAAIVPAYNEGERIAPVLKTLVNTDIIEEVVVVDDGSTDNTAAVVAGFPDVRYYKNDKNMGKSFSMERGVSETGAPIIFFCDADLSGFTPEIVKKIILPVKTGIVDMSIGLRKNLMQKTVKLFALNSGERALRRELWENLPRRFKHRYRIEAGLNYYASKYGKGYEAAEYDYYQKAKESKYGFMRGTILRWWLNLDVGFAYFLILIDWLKRIKSTNRLK